MFAMFQSLYMSIFFRPKEVHLFRGYQKKAQVFVKLFDTNATLLYMLNNKESAILKVKTLMHKGPTLQAWGSSVGPHPKDY